MKGVILAAGEGTRMLPLTETRPKPLIPVANKPIIQHIIETFKAAGIREIVIVQDEDIGGGQLREIFELAEGIGRYDDPLRPGYPPEGGHRHLPADDHGHYPCLHPSQRNQHDEGGTDQEFIGEGIEELAHIADRVPSAREIAIKPIAEGSQKKNKGGGKTRPPTGKEEEQEGNEGYGSYAKEGKAIGQVPEAHLAGPHRVATVLVGDFSLYSW